MVEIDIVTLRRFGTLARFQFIQNFNRVLPAKIFSGISALEGTPSCGSFSLRANSKCTCLKSIVHDGLNFVFAQGTIQQRDIVDEPVKIAGVIRASTL